MILYAGKRTRMKRLHEQRSNATNQSAKICVHYPGCIGRHEEAGIITLGHYLKPRWNTVWVT
jgi:hypothetical protein